MFYFLGVLIGSIIMGFITQKIIYNKGYDNNWFWWGFFFGIFAVFAACAKSKNVVTPSNYTPAHDSPSYGGTSIFNDASPQSTKRNLVPSGSWKCSCDRVNPQYTGTCACGMTQQKVKENQAAAIAQKESEQKKAEEEKQEQERLNKLKRLKEYKELFESGIITQEEFDQKKSELL